MKNVTVYMGPMCGYCDAAKRLLARNNISYKEINMAKELFHKYFLMKIM